MVFSCFPCPISVLLIGQGASNLHLGFRICFPFAMDSIAMVEELAWLVKDNLSSKHLVLSVEERFLGLLEPSYSGAGTLMLEPMVSYHRMLLHRLAEIFGLAHKSIGEGDDRRIVVEICEDSTIPDVLVSDILECTDHDGDNPCSEMTRQLLKRDIDTFGTKDKPLVQAPRVSFQERQSAYFAARDRIFSEDWGQQVENGKVQAPSRPRSVPVVARRMIAHALGKRVSADSCPPNVVPSSETATEKLLDQKSSTKDDVLRTAQEDPSESVAKHSPGKAAKRMLAQALGIPLTNPSFRASVKQLSSNSIDSAMSACTEGNGLNCIHLANNLCDVDREELAMFPGRGVSAGFCKELSQQKPPTVEVFHEHKPGRCAQRLLAQALGLRSPRSATVNDGVRTDDGGTAL